MTAIHKKRIRIKRRVRAKLHGTAERPRISVYRSNLHISAQAINDDASITIYGISCTALKLKDLTKMAESKALGIEMGKKLKELKIKSAIFDRGYYKYTGRVAAFADGLREAEITI